MNTKTLGRILIGCSAGMWTGVIGTFFAESWWPVFMLGGAVCAIGFVAIIVWAAGLEP